MKRIYLFLLVLLTSFSNNLNAASVSSTSGTFSNNQIVTINGSGFGTKSPVAPWLYDDFESQASGVVVRTHTPEVGTATYSAFPSDASDSTVSHYSNTRSWNGSQSAFGHNATDDQSIAHDNFWAGGQATTTRFVSYMWYWTGVGSGVWKVDRMTSGIGGNVPYDACPNQGWGNSEGAYYNNCSEFLDIIGGSGYNLGDMISDYTPKNTWHRIDHWLNTGTKGSSDGRWAMWVNRINIFDKTIMLCSNSAANCRFDTWVSPMLTLDGTNVTDVWVDHLYIDNTQMRVEIGDNPTWASCTKRVVQVPQTTWSDSQIQIKVKQGDLASGTNYLFVVDSNGAVIDLNGASTGQGYAITFGSGGGDTTAPVVTTKTIAANGTTLTLAFDETVSIGSGGNGGWTISPSGGAATLTYSSGSGSSSLVYTISRPIQFNETATVSYTQPTDGVEDTSGNDLVTFSGSSVTNNSTQGQDTTPAAFSFTDTTGATRSTQYTALVQITGINTGITCTGSGGTVAACTGATEGTCGTFGSTSGTITNNQYVAARVTSSVSYSTAVNNLVTCGGVTDTYSVTTLANPGDVTPPVCTITSPTTDTTWPTSSATLTIQGSATDAVGVTSISFTCPTCTPSSGTANCSGCTGTSVTWSQLVAFSSGANTFTATATDGVNTHADSIIITYTPVVVQDPPSSIRGITIRGVYRR